MRKPIAVTEAKKFLFEFILDEMPYAIFVNGCGLSADKNGPYLLVNLKNKLPKDVVLPSHFAGTRVKSQVVGKVRKLKM